MALSLEFNNRTFDFETALVGFCSETPQGIGFIEFSHITAVTADREHGGPMPMLGIHAGYIGVDRLEPVSGSLFDQLVESAIDRWRRRNLVLAGSIENFISGHGPAGRLQDPQNLLMFGRFSNCAFHRGFPNFSSEG
jgi:hypothetical protein